MMVLTAARRAAAAARAISRGISTPAALVELREYALKPEGAAAYAAATARASDVRLAHLPLRLFVLPETGGALNVATHFYTYPGGHAERAAARAAAASDARWTEYLAEARPHVGSQRSTLFTEAPLLDGIRGLASTDPLPDPSDGPSSSANPTVYELRRYRLRLGYDTVPRFFALYGAGLPSKLENQPKSTTLVTLLASEVGALNEVIEVWRHADGARGMEQSRAAARAAGPWREAIAEIAGLANTFETTLYHPTSFSPLQ
jgi:hypothetical protein